MTLCTAGRALDDAEAAEDVEGVNEAAAEGEEEMTEDSEEVDDAGWDVGDDDDEAATEANARITQSSHGIVIRQETDRLRMASDDSHG